MEDQTFEGKDFTGQSFAGKQFTHCTFINCNLSLVNLDGCRLHEVTFRECKIVGAKFFLCDKRFFSITGDKSIFKSCNFSGLKMKKADLSGSSLAECDFNETELAEVNFTDCDLQGTLFHNCNLSKADFRGAQNYALDPQTNKLTKAQFSIPEVLILLKGFDIKIS